MACDPDALKDVALFELLDEEELAVLAAQVERKEYTPLQRIYKMGDPGGRAYVMVSGKVRLTTIDEDHREVVLSEPEAGELFGLASMLEGTPHQTTAVVVEPAVCIEIDRNDIAVLLQVKPHAGLDILAVLGRHVHAAHELVRGRATRNVNEIIEEETTFGERLADEVARFGGSWSFIILFGVVLAIYTAINIALGKGAWDPYPFILLNLFLSMLAAIQAPVIMMSQNRQDAKDRLRGEMDFDVNRRAETGIQDLARRLEHLNDKFDDLAEQIRPGSAPVTTVSKTD
jgi:CRP/FNR family transcriptional regulator, cyclic AMP receptor protein